MYKVWGKTYYTVFLTNENSALFHTLMLNVYAKNIIIKKLYNENKICDIIGCHCRINGACGNDRKVEPGPSLKEAASGKFLMGVALNVRQAAGQDTYASKVVKRHFNSIVAENCMKCEVIHPEEDRFDFTEADRLVRFGEENDMAVIGHCLIWHSQLAPWFCVDEQGKTVSADILKERIKKHIQTIVTHYKGV